MRLRLNNWVHFLKFQRITVLWLFIETTVFLFQCAIASRRIWIWASVRLLRESKFTVNKWKMRPSSTTANYEETNEIHLLRNTINSFSSQCVLSSCPIDARQYTLSVTYLHGFIYFLENLISVLQHSRSYDPFFK